MKFTFLLLALASVSADTAMVMEFIADYFETVEKYKDRHYDRIIKRQEKGPLKWHEKPQVRASIISDNWKAFWGFMADPNENTFWNIFAINSSYYFLPLVAGYFRANAAIQYAKDSKTYDNSEVSMDYMFAESLTLFKMGYWKFFNLLTNDNERRYAS